MQRTLARTIRLSGIGVHSGAPATAKIMPAPCDTGVRFVRIDVEDRDNLIDARFDAVTDTALCTCIGNDDGVKVSTIEHLMAALAGCGIDNALIEVDGPEVPIMDGSAAPFIDAILAAGTIEQDEPLRVIRILKPVTVTLGDKTAELVPADQFEIEYDIDFTDAAIGKQHRFERFTGDAFLRGYANSRTFCTLGDVEALRKVGFARGGTLQNAIVVDAGRVLNRGGLRHRDEFVRHKMLDAVGDLALAGVPVIGRYRGVRAGHDMTNRLLHALFADPTAWRYEETSVRGTIAPDYMTSDPANTALACA
jgi:UDP-3-O-[3-hydroxymyristoyl] N-acetylglucosamine deacetylase